MHLGQVYVWTADCHHGPKWGREVFPHEYSGRIQVGHHCHIMLCLLFSLQIKFSNNCLFPAAVILQTRANIMHWVTHHWLVIQLCSLDAKCSAYVGDISRLKLFSFFAFLLIKLAYDC